MGSWGFSPDARHWAAFVAWADGLAPGFRPYVAGLQPTARYKEFERTGRCPGKRCMWTMLHIKYSDAHPDRMVVYSRLPSGETLAANYQDTSN